MLHCCVLCCVVLCWLGEQLYIYILDHDVVTTNIMTPPHILCFAAPSGLGPAPDWPLSPQHHNNNAGDATTANHCALVRLFCFSWQSYWAMQRQNYHHFVFGSSWYYDYDYRVVAVLLCAHYYHHHHTICCTAIIMCWCYSGFSLFFFGVARRPPRARGKRIRE